MQDADDDLGDSKDWRTYLEDFRIACIEYGAQIRHIRVGRELLVPVEPTKPPN